MYKIYLFELESLSLGLTLPQEIGGLHNDCLAILQITCKHQVGVVLDDLASIEPEKVTTRCVGWDSVFSKGLEAGVVADEVVDRLSSISTAAIKDLSNLPHSRAKEERVDKCLRNVSTPAYSSKSSLVEGVGVSARIFASRDESCCEAFVIHVVGEDSELDSVGVDPDEVTISTSRP